MADEEAAAKSPQTFYIGTGRRKTAVARVRITEGKGQVLINGRPLDDYFTEDKDRAAVLGPLKVTDQLNRVDVFVNAKGGGITGQAGAVSPGPGPRHEDDVQPEGRAEGERVRQHDRHQGLPRREAASARRAKAIPAKPRRAGPPAARSTDAGSRCIPGGTPAAPRRPRPTPPRAWSRSSATPATSPATPA